MPAAAMEGSEAPRALPHHLSINKNPPLTNNQTRRRARLRVAAAAMWACFEEPSGHPMGIPPPQIEAPEIVPSPIPKSLRV
jgi:hypothetical protein